MGKKLLILLLLTIAVLSLIITEIGMFPVLLLWGVLLLYSIKDLDNRITFFAFLISFFTFLLGRLLVQSFTKDTPEDLFNVYIDFKASTEDFILKTLFVSLCVVFIGYSFGQRVRSKKRDVAQNNTSYSSNLQKYAKWLVYLTFVFDLIETMDRVRYVWSNGYFNYYMSYEPNLPYIVEKLSSFFVFAVFLFYQLFHPRKGQR